MKAKTERGRFIRVCKVSDLADPGKTIVAAGDRTVALFHVSGRFWATDDRCTHDGGPLVAGRLEGHTIVCPRHGPSSTSARARLFCRPPP